MKNNIPSSELLIDAHKLPADLQEFFEPALCGECYVCRMVEVFRLARDLLADDGTLWLNLGDSYTGGGRGGGAEGSKQQTNVGSLPDSLKADTFRRGAGRADGLVTDESPRNRDGIGPVAGLPAKNLVGIPWRVAFALQADGWYLRQDIIWAKPNPMPESVRDRCTKAHEYIFLLSKNERYYFDADAIKEPYAETSIHRMQTPIGSENCKDWEKSGDVVGVRAHLNSGKIVEVNDAGRNKRSVWTVTTKPFSGAHFATFPPDLIEPCIMAGCPVGGIVLDPFMGSGTTAQVAQALGRQWIGCELNEDYGPLQQDRTRQMGMAL